MQIALISHTCENSIVCQRAHDGYVNATAMCTATGKRFNDYSRLANTQDFLAELSAVTGIPVTGADGLVITVQGGIPEEQGTWVHPQVAINLGQWCSPAFAVAVSKWVMDWATGKIRAPGLPYHIRRYLANKNEVPPTHFSMLNEMLLSLIAPMEEIGYEMPDNLVPDISSGKMFSSFLRKNGVDTSAMPVYMHTYEDGRQFQARLYPNKYLAAFRIYFRDTWMPQRALDYFESRDPKALDYLPRLLGPAAEGQLPLPAAARAKPKSGRALPPKPSQKELPQGPSKKQEPGARMFD